jgi:hypothetical protein
MELTNQLRRFLSGTKTSEALSGSPALRDAISVATHLEVPATRALLRGQSVVVAGSAGGGKTHLVDETVRHVEAEGRRTVPWHGEHDESPDDQQAIRVVTDLTALAPELRRRALEVAAGGAAIIGANEGPLLGLAREHRDSPYAIAVDLLHRGQNGQEVPFDGTKPMVIDVGGFDPVETDVPQQILQLELLSSLVQESDCVCIPHVCPRRKAWKQLEHPGVVGRVGELLRTASGEGHSVLFRELWDFIGDLALGGDCEESPPTSPWFWRVFFGESRLSRRLRDHVDPRLLVFPKAEAFLWYRHWLAPELGIFDGVLPLSTQGTEPLSPAEFLWAKVQLFFVTERASTLDLLRSEFNLELTRSLESGRTTEVLRSLNTYMTYGSLPSPSTQLDLWSDMGVERRMDRPRTQVSLGTARDADLAIERSFVVINGDASSDEAVSLRGARRFLVHRPSGASLTLTPGTLSLLRSGRSYRSSDRPHTDLEWSIARFFSRIAAHASTTENLDVVHLDFRTMTATRREYSLSRSSKSIEPSW